MFWRGIMMDLSLNETIRYTKSMAGKYALIRGVGMRILNFGSVNVDHVYQVDDFVRPGETKRSLGFQMFPGGKGLNQSVALARAGACVCHAGKIGADGAWLEKLMRDSGVDTRYLASSSEDTGRAIIQVSREGQNAILLYDGANQTMDETYIRQTLEHFKEGDILLLQNEINHIPLLMDLAYEKGMRIAFNPSPANAIIRQCPLHKVTWLLINEIEGEWLTGEKEPDKICDILLSDHPHMAIVLTLGSQGALYRADGQRIFQKAFKTDTVDTTGAGDTFTGYFLKCVADEEPVEQALRLAARAAAISVSRPGAAVSIPLWEEVRD